MKTQTNITINLNIIIDRGMITMIGYNIFAKICKTTYIKSGLDQG